MSRILGRSEAIGRVSISSLARLLHKRSPLACEPYPILAQLWPYLFLHAS